VRLTGLVPKGRVHVVHGSHSPSSALDLRLMGRITVVLLTNLAKHLGIPMSLMELLLFSRSPLTAFVCERACVRRVRETHPRAAHDAITMLQHRRKVVHRYGDESFLASDTVHVQWSCQLCTLNNPASRRFCAACQGPRPLSRGTRASLHSSSSSVRRWTDAIHRCRYSCGACR
jgi:hypothetical protein